MTGRRIAALACALASFVFSSVASADWLADQAKPDSSYSTTADLATPFQATSEAARALRLLGRLSEAAPAEAYLQSDPYLGSEFLSRKLRATAQAGGTPTAQRAQLLSYQNADGGFGEAQGYSSTALDTAFVLDALTSSGPLQNSQQFAAAAYLLAQQGVDGSWSPTLQYSAVYVTAHVVRALWPYRSTLGGINAAIANARTFLLNERSGSGLWDEDFETALALIALLPTQSAPTELGASVTALTGRRLANGSWGGDVFSTALALQALAIAAQPAPNPDLGRIMGKLEDGDTGASIAGADVNVTGAMSAADASDEIGLFQLEHLTAGAYQLEVEASGFPTLTSTVTLRAGEQLNLGTLRLLASGNPTTARVQGLVLDQTTSVPIPGVTVAVTGTPAVQTDASGRFLLNAVPPGAAVLTASKTGYHAVQGQTTLVAGATFDFSVSMRQITAAGFDVTGTFRDEATTAVVSGVAVSITGSATASTTSDSSGQVSLTGLTPGSIQVSISRSGYLPRSVVAQVESGQLLDLTADLTPTPPSPPSTFTITGQVTNRNSGAAIAGATIDVSGDATGNDTTDANGRYEIGGLPPGDIEVTASAAGFVGASAETTTQAAQVIDFSPALVAVSEAANGLRGSVVNAETLAPIVGAQVVAQIGASTQNATTDGNGAFIFRNLPIGSALVSITAVDFLASAFTIEIQAATFIGVGQIRLFPEDFEVPVTLAGVIVDSTTNQPIPGATITVSRVTGPEMITANSVGEFTIEADSSELLDLSFASSGYQTTEITIEAGIEGADLGQIRLRPTGLEDLLADLTVRVVDRSSVTHDPDAFAVGSTLTAEIQNRGYEAVGNGLLVSAFEDLNTNGLLDTSDTALGSTTLAANVAAGTVTTVSIPVSGTLSFRDAPIAVMVDAALQLVERDEQNNVTSTAAVCQAIPPPTSALDPVVKWHWMGSPALPTSRNVFGPPLVAQTSDDNGDGQINALDVPDVIFTIQGGALTVVSGDDGRTLWQTANGIATSLGSVAVGDIDGDGLVEIVSGNPSRTQLLAWENDGTLKWSVPHGPTHPESSRDAVAIADLNADGTPEIIVGRRAYSNTGALLWQGTNDHGGETSYGLNSIAVDLNDDGLLEVVAGRSAYTSTGALLWHQSGAIGDGFTAIGNLDADASPEIVLISTGRVYVLEHTGTIKWGPVLLPLSGNRGGAPTVGDFDGDGQAEIGIAGQTRYTVLETDGSIKWSAVTVDVSSARTGSSLFDFDGDGRTEVVYADEQDLFIFDGATGAVIQQIENGSGTTLEYPVVADVDGDDRAELVVTSTSPGVQGVRAFEGGQAEWMPTRPIWNQHSYHVTNVNDDGTIPAVEAASWLGDNSYRQNSTIPSELEAAPDLTAGNLRILDSGTGQPVTLRVRVGNAGAAVESGLAIVAFYNGLPESGGTELGTVTLGALARGASLDVDLGNVTGVSASGTVVVIVDRLERVTECNENNNRATTTARPSQGAVEVETDAAEYSPDELVGISVDVENTGNYTSSYTVDLRILDDGGSPVATLQSLTVAALAPAAQAVLNSLWDSGSSLAGTYQVEAILRSSGGQNLDTATANFEIRHAPSSGSVASVRVRPDRPTYSTSATVELASLVRNLSVATVIANAELRLTVTRPSGTTLTTRTVALGDLVAGGSRNHAEYVALSAAEEGSYPVQAALYDSANNLQATGSATFTVIEDLTAALAGAVSVSSEQLEAGQTQICTETIQNRGTLNLGAQAIRHVVVALPSEVIRHEQSGTAVLAPSGSHTDIRSFSTSGYVAGEHACVLQAQVGGTWHNVAYDTFTVTQPPVDIDATLSVGPRGRLLALLDNVDGWTCAPAKNIELWTGFEEELAQDAVIDLELLDASGQLIETESVTVSTYSGTINNVTGNAVDLLITGVSTGVLTVELRSATTLPQGLALFAWVSSSAGWSGTLTTGPMGSHCGLPYGVGVPFRDFEISRFDLPSGAPTPPAWTGAPSLAAQRAFLEGILDAQGWSYTIVEDDEAFEDAMRSGQYGVYALFAEHATLDFDVQRELREAVYRGEGLLDAGEHDDRHYFFDAALGIQLEGRAATAQGVEFLSSEVHAATTVALGLEHAQEGDVLDISLAGAQAVALYDSTSSAEAITKHVYGAGKSVFVGYDLLAEATAAGANSVHANALRNALEHVKPNLAQPKWGQTIPIRLTLDNQSGAAATRTTLPVPNQVSVIDQDVAQLASGVLSWTFELGSGEERALDFWVQVPDQSGTVAWDALIQYLSGGVYVDHTHATLNLPVGTRASLSQARALAVGIPGDIVNWIDEAQAHVNAQAYDLAVKCILDTIDELILSGHTQAPAVREALDDVLWQLGRLR